jgi:hypothetical protein
MKKIKMKMKKIKFIAFLMIGLSFFSSCTKDVAIETGSSSKRCAINELSVEQITNLLYSKKLDEVQFIDIRNARDYSNGRLPNAVNIPSKVFFDKDQLSKIEADKYIVVYGYDSSSPRLISLLSSHFKKANLFVAMGGYDFIKSKIIDNYGIYSGIYDDEVPLCDYSKKMSSVASKAGSASTDAKPKTSTAPKPMIKRKKKEVSGGCG